MSLDFLNLIDSTFAVIIVVLAFLAWYLLGLMVLLRLDDWAVMHIGTLFPRHALPTILIWTVWPATALVWVYKILTRRRSVIDFVCR